MRPVIKNLQKTIAIACILCGTIFFAGQSKAASDISVLLTWSSDTYTPLEYQSYARTLPVKGASLMLNATPFATHVRTSKGLAQTTYTPKDPQSFYYVWYINGTKYDQGQGLSLETYRIDPYISMDTLDVRAQLFDATTGIVVTEQQAHIPIIQQPQVLLYQSQNNKVLPLAQQSFSGLRNSVLTITAQPYFFHVPQKNQISFSWQHGSQPITTVNNDPYSFEITLPDIRTNDIFSITLLNSLYKLQFITSQFLVQSQ